MNEIQDQSAESKDELPAANEGVVAAGKGVVYIGAAKIYFMAAGYAIYFALPRLLGSAVAWGNYLLVIGMVSVIDNVVVTGTIQAVSRFTAQDPSQNESVKRAALKVQLGLGGGIALAYVLLAPSIAGWERDLSLTSLYRLSSAVIIFYSFYAVFVGSLNGLRRFGHQAALDVGFATLRAGSILAFAAAGWGVRGAISGFILASFVILIISALWVGLPIRAGRFNASRIWAYGLHLFVYTLAANLMMRADLFLLKRYAVDLLRAGSQAIDVAAEASTIVAYYGTAQSLAYIPYQAILAIAFVIFPLISRTTFKADRLATQTYIRQTLRLSTLFAAGIAVVFAANPEAVLSVPYPEIYRRGAPALQILSFGMVAFSLFTIVNTILNGAGRTRATIVIALVTLALLVIANTIALPRAQSALLALQSAAWATSIAISTGLALSLLYLYLEFGAGIPWLTALRALCAVGVALILGRLIPEYSKLVTLAECLLVVAVYGVSLGVLGEFSAGDIALITRIFRKKNSATE